MENGKENMHLIFFISWLRELNHFVGLFSDTEVSEETPTVKPLKWEEDMQLFSRFLDRKVKSDFVLRFLLQTVLGLGVEFHLR